MRVITNTFTRKEEIKYIVGNTIIDCALALMENEQIDDWMIGVIKQSARELLEGSLRLDYSPNRRSSRGGIRNGKAMMSLALNCFVTWSDDRLKFFNEYRSFANDPQIGSMNFDDWKGSLRCLVAHEFAHVIQFAFWSAKDEDNNYRLSNKERSIMRPPHGHGFRNIYRILRTRVINGLYGKKIVEDVMMAASRKY